MRDDGSNISSEDCAILKGDKMSEIPQKTANMGFIILVSMVATLGGFLFGYDTGVIAGTVKGLEDAFNTSAAAKGFAVSSMLLGSAVGALIAGRLSDRFGRRNMLMVAALFFIVSAWGSGVANTIAEFISYRMLGGLAVGAASVMAPAYISEIAPARMRGALTSIQQMAIVFGFAACFFVNYFIAQSTGLTEGAQTAIISKFGVDAEAWRWMFWVELIPAVAFFLFLFLIPQSPRFLMIRNKDDKARKSLTRLFGAGVAEAKVADIRESLSTDHVPSFKDLFLGGKIRPIVWVGIGLAVFQQLVGINVIFYYGNVLWEAAGFAEGDAFKKQVIAGVLSVIAVSITMFTIDKFGRRLLMIVGSAGMAITLGIVAYAFSTGEVINLAEGEIVMSDGMGQIAFISAMVYAFLFNMTWGPVMWVLLGEMFPNQIRGAALAAAGFAQWIANFVVTLTFPLMLGSIGLAASFGIYSAFAFISILFVAKAVTETKGMELEDMVG